MVRKIFPADKILMTGNPVHKNLFTNNQSREGLQAFRPVRKENNIFGRPYAPLIIMLIAGVKP